MNSNIAIHLIYVFTISFLAFAGCASLAMGIIKLEMWYIIGAMALMTLAMVASIVDMMGNMSNEAKP